MKMLLDVKQCDMDIYEKNIFKQLALDKAREQKALEVMEDFVEPGDHILEAGANIGYYVLLEASRMNGKGKIYAIEPGIENFNLLKKNVALNHLQDFVETRHMAMSDKIGKIPFYITGKSNLHSCVLKDWESIKETVLVDTTTVDEFLKDKPEVNFVRMDIEGFECKVVHGMKKFLSRKGPLKLFIELHPHLVTTEDMIFLLDTLGAHGFEVHKLVSRDSFLRNCLGHTKVENSSIEKLKKDSRILKNKTAIEAFFIKK